jgi:hypothetical protein
MANSIEGESGRNTPENNLRSGINPQNEMVLFPGDTIPSLSREGVLLRMYAQSILMSYQQQGYFDVIPRDADPKAFALGLHVDRAADESGNPDINMTTIPEDISVGAGYVYQQQTHSIKGYATRPTRLSLADSMPFKGFFIPDLARDLLRSGAQGFHEYFDILNPRIPHYVERETYEQAELYKKSARAAKQIARMEQEGKVICNPLVWYNLATHYASETIVELMRFGLIRLPLSEQEERLFEESPLYETVTEPRFKASHDIDPEVAIVTSTRDPLLSMLAFCVSTAIHKLIDGKGVIDAATELYKGPNILSSFSRVARPGDELHVLPAGAAYYNAMYHGINPVILVQHPIFLMCLVDPKEIDIYKPLQ